MKTAFIIAALALSLAACANPHDTRMADGALLGGAGGAIIGGVATGTPGGALVGGVAGAAVGAVVADATDPGDSAVRCHYSRELHRRVCRQY